MVTKCCEVSSGNQLHQYEVKKSDISERLSVLPSLGSVVMGNKQTNKQTNTHTYTFQQMYLYYNNNDFSIKE
jgi:hypothetical protein